MPKDPTKKPPFKGVLFNRQDAYTTLFSTSCVVLESGTVDQIQMVKSIERDLRALLELQ